MGGGSSGANNQVSPGDFDLGDLSKLKPKVNINSIMDLIGTVVRAQKTVTVNNRPTTTTVTLKNPFSTDPSQAMQYLPELEDFVTPSTATSFPGRININQASRTLLLGIPGMTSDTVDSIIANREPEYTGQHPEQRSATWIYTTGLVTLGRDEISDALHHRRRQRLQRPNRRLFRSRRHIQPRPGHHRRRPAGQFQRLQRVVQLLQLPKFQQFLANFQRRISKRQQ